ncbi:MAG TPA: hypothetical protein VM901_07555 [Bdellovibrionota bacterium]|jgi:peptidyl-tRNA hydrolase|nr:hypothetical protein [Bdellovibrionota bacterium]
MSAFALIFSMLMMVSLNPRSAVASTTFSTELCEQMLQKALASSPPSIAECSQWESKDLSIDVDYTGAVRGERRIQIPSVLGALKDKYADLHVVVLAGNSGEEYRYTRHNAGFLFFDYLLSKHSFVSKTSEAPTGAVYREKVEITYDDSTSRDWVEDFVTEPEWFRTRSGEVFFLESALGKPVLVVKALSDYNELGDFAAPIVEFLGVPSHRVLLVRDDLNIPLGTVNRDDSVPNKFLGSNSEFSMGRSLAYASLKNLVGDLHALCDRYGFDQIATGEAETLIRDVLAIRYPGHLGQATLHHQAVKTPSAFGNAITTALQKTVDATIAESLRKNVEYQSLMQEFQVAKQSRGKKIQELGGMDKAKDHAEFQALDTALSALSDAKAKLEEPGKRFKADFEALVTQYGAEPFRFSRIKIGTRDESLVEGGQVDFVLAPIKADHFGQAIFGDVESALRSWLQSPES